MPATAVESLSMSAPDGAKLIGCGRTLFLQMDKDGRLGPESFKLGGARRWARDELLAWFTAGRPRREAWVKLRDAGTKGR
jgi:predicted DNA-binding transcriptional regulator AlpA